MLVKCHPRKIGALQFQRGLTLVELLVTVTLLVILLFLAAPNFITWINNTRVRTVAEVLQNGVRFAQAEAIRRNRSVVFYLTNAEPSLAAAAVANGTNWGRARWRCFRPTFRPSSRVERCPMSPQG